MMPLSLAAFLAIISTGGAFQCYICSWSPKDVNRTDNCTDKNFDPQNVPSDTCEHGCEIFVLWDKNGELDQWRRNCFQRGTNLTGDCIREQNVASARQRCTCTVDFCNSSPDVKLKPILFAAFVLLSLVGPRAVLA